MGEQRKVLHEYTYVINRPDLFQKYDLVVDRETEKMLYGQAFGNNFAVKKSDLSKVKIFVDRKYGTFYRITIDSSMIEDTCAYAKELINITLYKEIQNMMQNCNI